MNTGEKVKLDEEWVYLILTAKELGLSVEEVKSFIRKEEIVRDSHN
ncbi:anti-repressor SinI family protein [Guptibacillus algicola]|nr:anti-repressor SinI family protein [Alkalihalobacillus algicola]MCA0987108.1 anti-repressor SinI family protein [Alkalihalobacillus algicola]